MSGRGEVAVGAGHAHVHAGHGTAEQVGVGHVVGRVTEVGDGLVLQVVDAASVLGDGLEVGENLAGMEVIGQGVTTGWVEYLAISSTRPWPKVRHTTP